MNNLVHCQEISNTLKHDYFIYHLQKKFYLDHNFIVSVSCDNEIVSLTLQCAVGNCPVFLLQCLGAQSSLAEFIGLKQK